MTRDQILANMADLDRLLLDLAAQELQHSRRHLPGQHGERYQELRAEARVINDLKMDWYNLMPPSPIYVSRGTHHTVVLSPPDHADSW